MKYMFHNVFLFLFYLPSEVRSDSEKKSEIESLKSEIGSLKEQIVQQKQELQTKAAQVGQPDHCWTIFGFTAVLLCKTSSFKKLIPRLCDIMCFSIHRLVCC